MFADSLTGGDVGKLFKMMENGEIRLEQLEKVIDHMAAITNPELIAKMMDTPAKKFEKMRTAWVRMLEATNDSGILNLMVKTFEEMADVLGDLSRWVRLNKEGFETFGKVVGRTWLVIKTAIQMLLPYWKELLSLLIVSKVYAFAAALQVLGKSITGVLARLFFVPLLVAGAVAALLDLNDAVNGKNSFFKDWAKDDQWYSGFAKFVLLLADAVKYSKELFTSGVAELYGKATGNQALVDSAKAARLSATTRSDKLQGEVLGESGKFEKILYNSLIAVVGTMISPTSGFKFSGAFKDSVDQVNSPQAQANPQRSMFGQGAQGQGVLNLPSQSSQSTQVNHITVNAPTREGGEIARQVAQALPNYVRDK